MSLSREIAPNLPYLRRFARALTGSQASGDAFVVETLEALVADNSIFPRDLPVKPALYQVFLRIWSSIGPQMEAPAGAPGVEDGAEDGAEDRLGAITPRPRQAFLLRTVEGFSLEDTALILDENIETTRDLLDEAGREITSQVATDVLIIEDEAVIAMDSEALLEDMGHRVVAIARTHKEAVAAAREHRPGLVLADIQLADGSSGIDAVNELLTEFSVPVVFITAYPERLLTGERPEPAFMITKPFHVDTVKAAVSQALFFNRRAARRPAA